MKTSILFAALGFLILTGCITNPDKPTMNASAFNQPIGRIDVMPVIDARKDKSGEFDAGDVQRVRDLVRTKLQGLGYQAVLVDSWRKEASTTDEQLAQMSDAALCQLAPAESQVFLAITVTDVNDTYAAVMSSYTITGAFTLIDRAKGAAIWKCSGTGAHGGGGIIGSVVVQADKRIEAQTGFVNILSSVPPNKK